LHKISLSFIIDCNDINNLLNTNFLNDSDICIEDDNDDDDDDDEIEGF